VDIMLSIKTDISHFLLPMLLKMGILKFKK
jgi:hypothetical protein